MRISERIGAIFLMFVFFASASPQGENDKNSAVDQTKTPLSTDDTHRQAQFYANQWSGKDVRRSIDLYDELYVKHKADGDLRRTAETLIETSQLYLLLEKYDKAALNLEEALKINRTINDDGLRAQSLGLLSVVALRGGKVEKSREYVKRALEINLPDGEVSAKATVFSAAAELYYLDRKIDETISFCRQAIALWRASNDVKGEVSQLRLLSYAHIAADDLRNALDALNSAIQKSRENNLRREEAFSQYQMGFYYLITDEPQKALEVCRVAETLFPVDMDFIEKARLMNGIGSIYESYGDWKTAGRYRQKALILFQKDNYSIGQIATLPSLIKASFLGGDEQSAFEYYRQTEILSAQLNDSFFLANADASLADFYNLKGQDEKAIEYYLKSLEPLKKLHFTDGVVMAENNLGKVYARLKNFKLSERYFSSALEKSVETRNKLSESETLFNFAQLRSDQNDIAGALKLAAESVEITDLLSAGVVNAKLKTTYFSNVFKRYELYINLLMKMHRAHPGENYAVRALQVSEKARARRMLENLALSESDFTKDAPGELVEREREIRNLLNLKTDKLSNLLNRNDDKKAVVETEDEIDALEIELEEIKARFRQNSPRYAAVKDPAPFDVSDFQNEILDENTILLEFSFGDEESYLWQVGKNEVASYTLLPRERLETKIEYLRELLAENTLRENEPIEDYQTRIIAAGQRYQTAAADLSRELFGQITENLAGKRLVVVADGKLHYFPVAALPAPGAADDEPILLTNEVVYEPSASLLMMLKQNGAARTGAAEDLLVFADPVFSADDARFANSENSASPSTDGFRFSESLDSLSRLVASKDEANSILDIVGKSSAAQFSGFEATRQKLLETNISDYKILHFATHGLINEERPELSAIILSRFDRNANKLDESIRLRDIYAMNINSELVVLSACDTGIGKEVKGEGLMSLTNAFLQSGSRSVVSSLWKVDDFATLELMKNFYREMSEENVSPPVALRRSQIKMWENPQYRSPFFWAAFTFQGDYQTKPEFSKTGNFAIPLISLFLMLALFAIFAKRFYFSKKRPA